MEEKSSPFICPKRAAARSPDGLHALPMRGNMNLIGSVWSSGVGRVPAPTGSCSSRTCRPLSHWIETLGMLGDL